MAFHPDYHNLEDAAWNRVPARMPLYEHLVATSVMEDVLKTRFDHLYERDKPAFFREYCRFFEEMGYDTVINFGNPDNYVARGYKSCRKYNVCFEGDIYPAALLVKPLKDGVFDGRKWYYHQNDADAPCEDEAAVEEYDKLFPPMKKAWQPSQEEFYIHSHSVIARE